MEQQKQKQRNSRCQVDQLQIPVLHQLDSSKYEFGNQLLVYINNSKIPMIQFQRALTENEIAFEIFSEGLIAKKYRPNITLVYFQNIYFDDKGGHGWLIRAENFLLEICNNEKINELQFVFHFSTILNQNEQAIEQISLIYQTLVRPVYEANSTPYMALIEGDDFEKLTIKQQNICFQNFFEDSLSKDTLEMELNKIMPYLVLHTTLQGRKNTNSLFDYMVFSYIQDQISLLFDEFFDEIITFYKLILFLLEVNVDAQDKDTVVQNFRILVKEILLDFPKEFHFERLKETLIKIDQFFLQTVPLKFKEITKCLKKIMQKNSSLQDELQESVYIKKGYYFNFQFSDYTQMFEHYRDYLPFDKIQIKFQQNCKTVVTLLNNYDKQIELKLHILSQLINLNFAYRETQKKSIFVLGLSKVGKSTLLNILKQPQCLEIKNVDYIPSFVKREQEVPLTMTQQIAQDDEASNDIEISSLCVSQTDSLNYVTIQKNMFVDTPGFEDTNEKVRLRNILNIYQGIHKMNEVAFILVFDGHEMQKNKTNFQNTLNQFITIVGHKFLEKHPTSFILPIFTKVYPTTIQLLKTNWKQIEQNTEGLLKTMIKIIKLSLDQNNFVEIFDANYLKCENFDLTKYLEDVKRNVLAKCEILFKEQFMYEVQRPELKLTLRSDLQQQFNHVIEQGQFFLDQLAEYLQKEILIQLFEISRDQNDLKNFLEFTQQAIIQLSKQKDFMESCEQFQELFNNVKVQLNFEHNHYYQNLSNQFFKLIEIYKVTQQMDLLSQFKCYDFSMLINTFKNLDISFKKAIELINQDKSKKQTFFQSLKAINSCNNGIKTISPLSLLFFVALPELAIVAVLASTAATITLEMISKKLKSQQTTLEKKLRNQEFQIIFKEFYEKEELKKK